MSVDGVVSAILLVAGLVVVAGSCIGIAVMDDPLDRLHLVTPAAMLGAVALCAAVVVREALSASGLAAILVGVIIVGTSPFASHAVARSIMVRRELGPDGFDAARDQAAGRSKTKGEPPGTERGRG